MVFKKLLWACALTCLCVSPVWAEPDSAPNAAELSSAPSSQTDVLAPFDGWDAENVFRLGSRASFSFGGADYYDRSGSDPTLRMFSAGLNYSLGGGLALHGSYVMQDVPEWELSDAGNESPHAWKVGFALSQERLRFTSLMVEYGQLDAGFRLPGNSGAYENNFAVPLSGARRGFTFSDQADVLFLGARQRWNRRFSFTGKTRFEFLFSFIQFFFGYIFFYFFHFVFYKFNCLIFVFGIEICLNKEIASVTKRVVFGINYVKNIFFHIFNEVNI